MFKERFTKETGKQFIVVLEAVMVGLAVIRKKIMGSNFPNRFKRDSNPSSTRSTYVLFICVVYKPYYYERQLPNYSIDILQKNDKGSSSSQALLRFLMARFF